MIRLLRYIFWIAAAVLGLAGWLSRAAWRSELRWTIVAALAVALLALAAWFAIDWRRSFRINEKARHHSGGGPGGDA